MHQNDSWININQHIDLEGALTEERLADLVRNYCDTCRHPDLPKFTLHDRRPWKGWWGSPESYKPGCYVIFSGAGEIMYLGKASLKATMGSRLASHERSNDARWSEATFVQMIEVTYPYEAPSLEEFLLGRMSTSHNVLGRVKPDL